MSDWMYIPSKDDITGWVRLLDEARWMNIEDLMHLHLQLHKLFGDSPNDALLEGERRISSELRSYGIEHRYTDALSTAAGTLVTDLAPPTLEELHCYLRDMPVHSGIVKLMQGVDKPEPVYVIIDETMLPAGTGKVILKQINKMMPPGIVVKPMPKAPKEDFARQMSAFNLELACNPRGRRNIAVVPWKQIVDSAPAMVLKSDEGGAKRIEIKVKVAKSEQLRDEDGREYRYVLGPVLVPEEEDAQGEIYSKEEVIKACHWWAQHSRVMSHRHVLQGGRTVSDEDIVPVENYTMPMDAPVNGVHIKDGTWMLGAKIYDAQAINDVDAGQFRSWSIGAEVWSWEEEVPEAA